MSLDRGRSANGPRRADTAWDTRNGCKPNGDGETSGNRCFDDQPAGRLGSCAAKQPGNARRRLRLPLSFVIGRYFVYILLCTLVVAGWPTAMFSSLMARGVIYQANWGSNNIEATLVSFAEQPTPDISAIPACYDYAVVDTDVSSVTHAAQSFSDVRAQALTVVRALRDAGDAAAQEEGTPAALDDAAHSGAATSANASRGADRSAGNLMRDGVYYDAVQLFDGRWLVLAYDYMPHWADRARAGWINPQDLWIVSMVAGVAVSVLIIALRASRVLTRKMAPLVTAAESVGAQSLDFHVPSSNVSQIDDVLAAMDRMRADLKMALEEQWETEAAHRQNVTRTAHDLKTPNSKIRLA